GALDVGEILADAHLDAATHPLVLGLVEPAVAVLFLEDLGDVDDVLGGVLTLLETDLLAEELAVARVDAAAERLHLLAVVVDVELARDVVAGSVEQARHGVAHVSAAR